MPEVNLRAFYIKMQSALLIFLKNINIFKNIRKVFGYKTQNEMMEMELANIKYQNLKLN